MPDNPSQLHFVLLCVAIPAATAAERILGAYGGAFMGDEKEGWRDYIPLLVESGFNTYDLKLHPAEFDPDDPEYAEFVARVANAVDEAGLAFYIYLYDSVRGRRNPENPGGPAFMGPDGVLNETRYCLYQYETWEYAFGRVFYLAEKSKTLPIKGVKMDIEVLMGMTPCVCDSCFTTYAAGHNHTDPVPAAERWEWILANGGEEAYRDHLEGLMDEVVKTFAQTAHAINPTLQLGMMPFGNDFLRRPFARHLATAEAPAVIDSWPMYNGLGYTDEVAQEYALVKELNPHNLYIPWFRINMYRPQDIGEHAFAAGVKTDGYNMWVIGMIHPAVVDAKPRPGYDLPVDFKDPLLYWQELGKGNRAVYEWLENPVEITWEPITPMGVVIDLLKIKVPNLKPLGEAAVAEDTAPPTGLRGVNHLHIHVADPARPIELAIRHLAGEARPSNIGFALVNENGVPAIEEQVAPGENKQVQVRVREAGTYTLAIETSEGGGPWYDVKVTSHPYAVDATEAYFFRRLPRQYFHVPDDRQSFRINYSIGGAQEARLQVWGPDGQVIMDDLLDADEAQRRTVEIEVPQELAGRIWSLHIGPPETMKAGHYSENYFLRMLDIPPYLSDRPEAVLIQAY